MPSKSHETIPLRENVFDLTEILETGAETASTVSLKLRVDP
jgi:hypothetical protein